MTEPELLRRKELAPRLGLSLTEFDRLRHSHQFPAPFKVDEKSDPLWFRRDVDEWIENKRKSAKITFGSLQNGCGA